MTKTNSPDRNGILFCLAANGFLWTERDDKKDIVDSGKQLLESRIRIIFFKDYFLCQIGQNAAL
jgi:hypothetical protein